MSMSGLSPIQLEAALAEQIYHRNENDARITLDQLGVKSVDLGDIGGLTPNGSADDLINGVSYYSPRGFEITVTVLDCTP
jgi:hypothetical protein